MLPGIRLPCQYQSATDAGAQTDINQIATWRLDQPEFAIGSGQRVVFDDNGATQGKCQIAGQVDITQSGQIRRLSDIAADRIDKSRKADAD